MTVYGFIGSGAIATHVARGLIKVGHEVLMSNSRGPASLELLVAELGERAKAATVEEAAAAAEVVFVGIPFNAIETLPRDLLRNKIVIDAVNYYPPRDGDVPSVQNGEAATSELIQEYLMDSRVAKGFNHIAAEHVTTDARQAGAHDRRALVTSSNHSDAAHLVDEIYGLLGFDTVHAGPLSESWRAEHGQPAFLERLSYNELITKLASATRNRNTVIE